MVNVAPLLYRSNIWVKFIKRTCPWIDWPRLEANVSRQGMAVMADLPLRWRLCLRCACVWRACFFVFMAHHLLNVSTAAKILRNTLFVVYIFLVFFCKSSWWNLFCMFVFWVFFVQFVSDAVMHDSKVNVCIWFQLTTHKTFRQVCKPFCCLAKHPSTAHRIFL